MTTLTQSLRAMNKPWQWIAIGIGTLIIWVIVATTTMKRANMPASHDMREAGIRQGFVSGADLRSPLASRAESTISHDALKMAVSPLTAGADRKIVRTSSLDMVVTHPTEVAGKIGAIAESLGGYLESSNRGGEDATSGTLTIRVPADQFEKALGEIRKLGLRIESEKVDAQDVTRQFVDQDARIRNLRAEEAGYLFIMKQAKTVKDMLAVSEQLSQVRGEIEEQQAEFNTLSRRIETVGIAISLRNEPAPPPGLALNWHPGDQLKESLHDGLDSVASYAATMTAILFYLPATLLWVATIGLSALAAWRIVRWGKRWFPAKPVDSAKA